MELISIKVISRNGKTVTQVVEGEGACEAVRNYTGPSAAIAYLVGRAPYYNQPLVSPGPVDEGREIVDDDGNKALSFGTFHGAIAYLRGLVPKPDVKKVTGDVGKEAGNISPDKKVKVSKGEPKKDKSK